MAYLTYDGLLRYHQGVKNLISEAIENFTNTRYYICQDGEYNPSTYVPIIQGELGIIYLVPKATEDIDVDESSIIGSAIVGTGTIANSTNIYYEYIYVDEKFERIGNNKINLDGYLKDSDIATDSQVAAMLNEISL